MIVWVLVLFPQKPGYPSSLLKAHKQNNKNHTAPGRPFAICTAAFTPDRTKSQQCSFRGYQESQELIFDSVLPGTLSNNTLHMALSLVTYYRFLLHFCMQNLSAAAPAATQLLHQSNERTQHPQNSKCASQTQTSLSPTDTQTIELWERSASITLCHTQL